MAQRHRKKSPREKDLTSRYMSGGMDADRVEQQERFTDRSKNAEQNKILKTSAMRAEADHQSAIDVEALPIGEVIQVFSVYSEVEHEGKPVLCIIRKTLSKISDTSIVVGDKVRFSPITEGRIGEKNQQDSPEGAIQQILPRKTVLTRTDSFKGIIQHPIVANAEQMLLVASLREPNVKWGLIDRMLVAAQAGGLKPIVCLNKVDLGSEKDLAAARDVLAHYRTIGVITVETSVDGNKGLEELRAILKDRITVLAGHSGVGKSSLARAIQPSLDLRVGAISGYTGKGRHTTTSARRYVLDTGGAVIDTPGVKMFGLWNVTRENLRAFFPDVADGTAPEWRRESFQRISDSLVEPGY
jgi:ribosome biogenesis GTPase